MRVLLVSYFFRAAVPAKLHALRGDVEIARAACDRDAQGIAGTIVIRADADICELNRMLEVLEPALAEQPRERSWQVNALSRHR